MRNAEWNVGRPPAATASLSLGRIREGGREGSLPACLPAYLLLDGRSTSTGLGVLTALRRKHGFKDQFFCSF